MSKNNNFKELESLKKILLKKKKKIISIESCTGGNFSSFINSIPGSSEIFDFGLITYSNDSKNKILKIPSNQLSKFGAVSSEISKKMIENTKYIFKPKNRIIVSISGIAGPSGGTKNKPVGTVFISLGINRKIITFKKLFKGNRIQIQRKIVIFVINEIILNA